MATQIDTDSAISPIKERQNSLEHALAHRAESKDLEDRGILHPGNPVIVQRQLELERAMTQDALKKNLAHTPEQKAALRDELIHRNILPETGNVAPSLIAHQKELEKSMLEDSLKNKLAHRPAPTEVIEKGILLPDEDPTNRKE